jgi:predicted transposase/invertase (TIGR01784 family)
VNRKRFKPQNDFIFKRLFGEAETKDLLIHLLNAIFLESGGKPIVDLTIIENKELTKELIDDKTGRLDIRAETIENEQINVEVQVAEQKHMEKRSLFYLGKMFVESIKAGEQYENLKKTITINLLNFSFLQTERYHSSFHLYEDRDKTQMLTDIIEIHFIEYLKFRKITKDLQKSAAPMVVVFRRKAGGRPIGGVDWNGSGNQESGRSAGMVERRRGDDSFVRSARIFQV